MDRSSLKQTPKNGKYSSRVEGSADRQKNNSKISNYYKHERQSSRKRERDEQRGKYTFEHCLVPFYF